MPKSIFIATILMMISVVPAFSQSRDAEILSAIADNSIRSPLDFVSESVSTVALDYIYSSDKSAPLDYISTAGPSPSDFETGNVDASSCIGALVAVTSAFSNKGFYTAGGWDMVKTMQSASATQLLSPVRGQITSGFGYRESFGRMHNGVDIALPVGDSVKVALPGVVECVSYEPKGYGHYVTVRHDNGMETRYAHLSLPLVRRGQVLEAYQVLGLSGNTGNSTGPHLHFEVRSFGTPVDPTNFFAITGGNIRFRSSYNYSHDSALYKTQAPDKHTYVIKAGDTLEKISKKTGVSERRISQLNSIMAGDRLEPGRMLILR